MADHVTQTLVAKSFVITTRLEVLSEFKGHYSILVGLIHPQTSLPMKVRSLGAFFGHFKRT